MLGDELERADLTPKGIPGDRGWALREERQGVIRGGKRFPEIMRALDVIHAANFSFLDFTWIFTFSS